MECWAQRSVILLYNTVNLITVFYTYSNHTWPTNHEVVVHVPVLFMALGPATAGAAVVAARLRSSWCLEIMFLWPKLLPLFTKHVSS